MNTRKYFSLFASLLLFACSKQITPVRTPTTSAEAYVNQYLTRPDLSALFARQPALSFSQNGLGVLPLIGIRQDSVYQTIDGFGYTLSGGSAGHLLQMTPAARATLLRELFDTTGNSIGISYLRLSIGASDLNAKVFSYNDLPAGETDPQMQRFDLGPDKQDVLPVLKEILAINPNIKLMGSPWSPPAWMKTNGDTRGGSLKPEWYDAYARYLVRYVQEMQKEGIRIDAITVQNEPLHPGNNPSLLMPAAEQAAFIKQSLGPQFRAAGLNTKIIIYDHNADRPDYPISILNDPAAKQYIDGSAFHLYAGPISALSEVKAAHPDKHLYFTEQWTGAPGKFAEDLQWHVATLTIGATRNWARCVLEWNLSSNPQLTPFTDRGGCSSCLGGVTIDGDRVVRNSGYYAVAHASRFVRPGSVRVDSNTIQDVPNVAFRTPAGKLVLIAVNTGAAAKQFAVRSGSKSFVASLDPGSVGTFVWE